MKSVDKMTLPELREMYERVGKAIEAAKVRAKVETRQEIARIASERGFKVEELFGAKAVLRQTIVPRFRDPKTGAVWAGRGRMPRDFDRSRAEQIG